MNDAHIDNLKLGRAMESKCIRLSFLPMSTCVPLYSILPQGSLYKSILSPARSRMDRMTKRTVMRSGKVEVAAKVIGPAVWRTQRDECRGTNTAPPEAAGLYTRSEADGVACR